MQCSPFLYNSGSYPLGICKEPQNKTLAPVSKCWRGPTRGHTCPGIRRALGWGDARPQLLSRPAWPPALTTEAGVCLVLHRDWCVQPLQSEDIRIHPKTSPHEVPVRMGWHSCSPCSPPCSGPSKTSQGPSPSCWGPTVSRSSTWSLYSRQDLQCACLQSGGLCCFHPALSDRDVSNAA